VVGCVGEKLSAEELVVPVMRDGEVLHTESLDQIRARATEQLRALPERLRTGGEDVEPYPVAYSDRLLGANGRARSR